MDHTDIINQQIEQAMQAMFPHGHGRTTDARVRHWLQTVAQRAFQAGRTHALMGLMTAEDVALHYQITPRRARALMQNRHERFGTGMKFGNSWLIHRDELPSLQPDEKHRA